MTRDNQLPPRVINALRDVQARWPLPVHDRPTLSLLAAVAGHEAAAAWLVHHPHIAYGVAAPRRRVAIPRHLARASMPRIRTDRTRRARTHARDLPCTRRSIAV